MTVMLVFMFKYKDHTTAPQIITGLSVENLIMFLLSTPVQVRKDFLFIYLFIFNFYLIDC